MVNIEKGNRAVEWYSGKKVTGPGGGTQVKGNRTGEWYAGEKGNRTGEWYTG